MNLGPRDAGGPAAGPLRAVREEGPLTAARPSPDARLLLLLQERPDGLGAAAGGARLSSLPQAAYGPAPPLCHTPAAAADFQPPYFPPPYPQPPLPYGQAPDAAAAAFPHLAGDPYGGLAPLAQPQPPQAAWAAPRAAAARAHNEPPGLLAPPARSLGLDPRRDYAAAAAVPRLLHGLADGAHGLADTPLGLPGLVAPPGLEDLQVRPELPRWSAENGKPALSRTRFLGSWPVRRRGPGLSATPGRQPPSAGLHGQGRSRCSAARRGRGEHLCRA